MDTNRFKSSLRRLIVVLPIGLIAYFPLSWLAKQAPEAIAAMLVVAIIGYVFKD